MLTESEVTILFRTALAAVLGLFIGWEREVVGAPVRGRSIAIATMTSAALAAVGETMYPHEASRIIAGILTGVGFLGAGLIIRSASGEVRGQVTAAMLWTMSSIGIIIGAGHEVLGIILTLMAYMIMAWEDWPLINRLKLRLAKRQAKEGNNQPSGETKETNF
jgi:putative Mg2+ transporter-C (MgtC) family protein